ncbi:cadmium resistance transporter [Weissella viridescens]|uniref:cadmium resistance transporter n=1 Tax=Weissella viridescens TaxID=1629 RepID=UPI002574AD33|nr:cadmium resistance transporter [Weissella viridescens]WJI90569.1 cadmium resistance transporter [Weissella viridescens]
MIHFIVSVIVAFISSNLDDLVILTILYAEATNRKQRSTILFGQLLGIGAILVLSIACVTMLHAFNLNYLNLLGIFPLLMGMSGFYKLYKADETAKKETAYHTKVKKQVHTATGLTLGTIMTLTISNGADNMGIYIPLFSKYSNARMWGVLGLFIIMIPIWCWIGQLISDLPVIRNFVQKYQKILVPVIYVGLGLYILFT